MAQRPKTTGGLRLAALVALAIFGTLAGRSTSAAARHDASQHRRLTTPSPTPSPTRSPTPTPTPVPVVLITGGTGIVDVAPTGESPAVLNTAEIYDPVVGEFLPISPMTTQRDRHSATALPDGRVFIVGGVDTVLVPLASFPGPAMPWILRSTEIFDPSDGRFTAAANMAAARDEPTATVLN